MIGAEKAPLGVQGFEEDPFSGFGIASRRQVNHGEIVGGDERMGMSRPQYAAGEGKQGFVYTSSFVELS